MCVCEIVAVIVDNDSIQTHSCGAFSRKVITGFIEARVEKFFRFAYFIFALFSSLLR